MSLLQVISLKGGSVAKRENKYQPDLIKRIEDRFSGCLVLKNDEQYRQGIPDLTILYKDRFAVLEVKRDAKEADDAIPNQVRYLQSIRSQGGFATFIYPENEEEVLDALQRSFEARR